LQPTLTVVSWEPLKEVKVDDRGLAADHEKKSLLSAASKVITGWKSIYVSPGE
jgi:hypothetical protein